MEILLLRLSKREEAVGILGSPSGDVAILDD
jgi:hypothetical protein